MTTATIAAKSNFEELVHAHANFLIDNGLWDISEQEVIDIGNRVSLGKNIGIVDEFDERVLEFYNLTHELKSPHRMRYLSHFFTEGLPDVDKCLTFFPERTRKAWKTLPSDQQSLDFLVTQESDFLLSTAELINVGICAEIRDMRDQPITSYSPVNSYVSPISIWLYCLSVNSDKYNVTRNSHDLLHAAIDNGDLLKNTHTQQPPPIYLYFAGAGLIESEVLASTLQHKECTIRYVQKEEYGYRVGKEIAKKLFSLKDMNHTIAHIEDDRFLSTKLRDYFYGFMGPTVLSKMGDGIVREHKADHDSLLFMMNSILNFPLETQKDILLHAKKMVKGGTAVFDLPLQSEEDQFAYITRENENFQTYIAEEFHRIPSTHFNPEYVKSTDGLGNDIYDVGIRMQKDTPLFNWLYLPEQEFFSNKPRVARAGEFISFFSSMRATPQYARQLARETGYSVILNDEKSHALFISEH